MRMHLIDLFKRDLRRIIGPHSAVKEDSVAAFKGFKVTRCSRGRACRMPDRFSTRFTRVERRISARLRILERGRMGEATPQVVCLDAFLFGFGKGENHSKYNQHLSRHGLS